MLLLVSGATVAMQGRDARFGRLYVPQDGNEARADRPYGLDNGAFSGFDPVAFLAMLQRFRGVPGCLFVVAPDVVADAGQTLALFAQWAPLIAALGFPVALAAQDGLTVPQVPWTSIQALFIGGSTAWKESPTARTLIGYAQARGKWAHMGRVNTRGRLRYAMRIGCDSVDGSGFSKWSAKRLPLAERWMTEWQQQPQLVERVAP